MEQEKIETSVLDILHKASTPLGATIISRKLKNYGVYLNPRTVCRYLKLLDEKGFTERIGIAGRICTKKGIHMLKKTTLKKTTY